MLITVYFSLRNREKKYRFGKEGPNRMITEAEMYQIGWVPLPMNSGRKVKKETWFRLFLHQGFSWQNFSHH